MKKIASLFFMLWCMSYSIANALPITNIVAFGDSLSDTGNIYKYTQGSFPPFPPYYEGHFSNGKIWVEHLTEFFFPNNPNDHLENYAFGGAGIATDNGDYFSLNSEIESYLSDHEKKANEDTLYVVWIGSNNYFGLIEEKDAGQKVEQATTDIISAMKRNLQVLNDAGAKKILILSLPDIGRTPAYINKPVLSSILTEAVTLHNRKLQTTIQQLQAQNPNSQWIYVDAWQTFDDALTYPEHYGLTNTTEACVKSDPTQNIHNYSPMLRFTAHTTPMRELANCEGFMFFDSVHPTVGIHEIIAKLAQNSLNDAGVEFKA